MADTDWSVVENKIDLNKSWVKFYNILNGAVKLSIPVCKRRPCKNDKLKWWNNKIEAELFKKKMHTQ